MAQVSSAHNMAAPSGSSGGVASSLRSSSSSSNASTQSPTDHHLVWSQSHVNVHPTPYARDNAAGYLALVRIGPDTPQAPHLLSFLPDALLQQRDEVHKYVQVERVRRSRRSQTRASNGTSATSSSAASQIDARQDGLEVEAGDEGEVEVEAVEVTDQESLLASTSALSEAGAGSSSFSIASRSGGSTTSPSSYAFSIPISQVFSLQVKPPSILGAGSWHGTVTIQTTTGVTLPTLFFHDDEEESPQDHHPSDCNLPGAGASSGPTWGGDGLLRELRRYADLYRSLLDSRVFLVNPTKQLIEQHSTPAYDDDLDRIPNDPPRRSAPSSRSGPAPFPDDPFSDGVGEGSSSHSYQYNGAEIDPLTEWAKGARQSVLTRFSHLTRHARLASNQLLSHPLARPYVPRLPRPVQSFAQAGPSPLPGPSDAEWKEIAARTGTGEYDSARVYLAKWARLVAEEGERNRKREEALLGGKAGKGGVPAMQAAGDEQGVLGVFEILAKSSPSLALPSSSRDPNTPIGLLEWNALFDAVSGRPLLPPADIRTRIFRRGLEPEARKAVWPYLLDVLPCDASHDERAKHMAALEFAYRSARARWEGRENVLSSDAVREQLHRIRVDCLRTDRKQPMFRKEPRTEEEEREEEQREARRDRGEKVEESERPEKPAERHLRCLGEILLTFGFWDTALGEAEEEESRAAEALAQGAYGSADTVVDKSSPATNGTGNEAEPATAEEEKGSTKAVSSPAARAPARPDLEGYVQGMSDLCAPLYIVFDGDEVLTFWAFVGLMRRMRSNFLADQSGMKALLLTLQGLIRTVDPALYAHLERADALNLFFCFRWLLISFKREFAFDDVLKLWECVWAAEPGQLRDLAGTPIPPVRVIVPNASGEAVPAIVLLPSPTPVDSPANATTDAPVQEQTATSPDGLTSHLGLMIALAVLRTHREPILGYLENFDEILQYMNGLAMNMDVDETLAQAEILTRALRTLLQSENVTAEGLQSSDALRVQIPDELRSLVR